MARKQKRWMKSVVETSKTDMPAMPWARSQKPAKRSQDVTPAQPAPVAKLRVG